jgi:hypothetical protein
MQSSSWVEVDVAFSELVDKTGSELLSEKKLFTTLLVFTMFVTKHCLAELNVAFSL